MALSLRPIALASRWPLHSVGARVLAVDCGASHVACGVFARGTGGRVWMEKFAVERLDPDPAADNRWHASLERAMASLAERNGFRGLCRIALPGHVTFTKFTTAPSLGAKPSPEAAAFEAQQNIPCPLEQVVWDHLLLADDGLDREVMLAAAKVETIGAIHAAVAGAGLTVEQITPAAIALVRAFHLQHSRPKENAVVADIGARSTNLAFVGPEYFFIRTLPFGGNAVTRAVADDLGLDFTAAEELKIRLCREDAFAAMDTVNSFALRQAADRFASRLQLEIVRTSIGWRRHRPALEPASLYLTGGGSLLPLLKGMLTESLQLQVIHFDPLRFVECSESVPTPAGADAAALASLVGIAAGGFDRARPGLSLLPPEQASQLTQRRRRPALATAVTCAVLTPLPVIGFHRHALHVAEDELGQLDDRLAPLRALVEGRDIQAGGLDDAKETLAELRALMAAKSSWTVFLADLQTRLSEVEDAWLDRLQVMPPPVGGSGRPGARPALRLAIGGRMLDVANPAVLTGPESFRRVDFLLQSLGRSPFVQAIDSERFDNGEPGVLRFDCVLRLRPEAL